MKSFTICLAIICACTLTTKAQVGNTLSYDGTFSNQYTSLPTGIVSSLTDDYTVEAWVYTPSPSSNYQRVFDFGNGTFANMFLTTSAASNNAPCFGILKPGSSQQVLFAPASFALAPNTWHHLAVVYTGFNSTGRLFVNGTLAVTNTGMTIRASELGNTLQNYFGKSQYADPYYNGMIDEVRISNIARYSSNFTPAFSNFTSDANTIALYHFDGGTGQAITDASGNGKHGFRGATVGAEYSDPSWPPATGTGASLNFDGVDDYVSLGNTLGNVGAIDFTVQAHFNSKSIAGNGLIIGNQATCNLNTFWGIKMLAGKISFEVSGSYVSCNWYAPCYPGYLIYQCYSGPCTPAYSIIQSPLTYNDGNWHTVTCIRQGNFIRMYVDDIMVASANTTYTIYLLSSNDLQIGSGSCGPFKGNIDEVRIWSRALTNSCELRTYEIPDTATGLVASYHFNQGVAGANNAGTTAVIDATHHDYWGFLTNFALTGNSSNWAAEAPVLDRSYTTYTSSGGNWSTPSTWSPAGVPCNGDNVTILPGANVTVNIPVSVRSLDVGFGATLTINQPLAVSASATVSGTMYVYQPLAVSSSVTIGQYGTLLAAAEASAAAWTINGRYIHNLISTSGLLPNTNNPGSMAWSAGSTCEILSEPPHLPTVPSYFGNANIIWNIPNFGSTRTLYLDGSHYLGTLTVLQGDLTCRLEPGLSACMSEYAQSGNSNVTMLSTKSNPNQTDIGGSISLNIATGNLYLAPYLNNKIVVGGSCLVNAGAGSMSILQGATLDVNNNVAINSGSLKIFTSATSPGTLNIKGGFLLNNGASVTVVGSGSVINFLGGAIHQYSSGGTISGDLNFNVNSGNTLQMAAVNTVVNGSSFTLQNGATMGITSPAGITTAGNATGNIQTTTRTFGTAANYIYNGSSVQSTGDALPATINNLTVNNAAGLSLTNGVTANVLALTNGSLSLGTNTLRINGAVSGSGKLKGSSTANLVLGGAAGILNFDQTSVSNRSIKNITFNAGATATLGDALDVYGDIEFTPSSSNSFNLNGKHLTLRSTPAYTARIGNLTGTTLSGETNITVERYIPNSGRKYRLLTPTVTTTGSIRSNWMEGGMNTAIGVPHDPVPGFGTHITGSGGNVNGFDITQSNAPSLYNAGNALVPTYTAIANTNETLNPLTGYFMFIRGDRSTDMTLANTNVPPTPIPLASSSTTLRATGTIKKGTISSFTNAPTGAGSFNLVTNPYPSPIDWGAVYAASSNITPYYTLWDPGYGYRGGFVTVFTDGTASSGAATQYIQSGQAFFVQALTDAPVMNIMESHKAAGNNNGIFLVDPPPVESFAVSLYYTEASGYRRIADGVKAIFNDSYSAAVDAFDAKEINNWDENIAIAREGKHLSIETRPVIINKDTLPLFMNNMKQMNYLFTFIPTSFTNAALKAELIDNYLNTRTLLSVIDTISVNFTVNADPASSASDRFKIVFGQFSPLAIDVLSIRAQNKNNGVQIDWSAKTETNMDRYELERSFNGINFTKIKTTVAVGNSSVAVNYNWFDANPQTGYNFYRIKAIDRMGETKYSDIVKVNMGDAKPAISVAPNPITNNEIGLQLTNLNKGDYTLILYNNLGQKIYSTPLKHNGGSATKNIPLGIILPTGTYRLVLLGGDSELMTTTIIKN